LARDTQREQALKEYLSEMSSLVLDRGLGPKLDTRDSTSGGAAVDTEVLTIARTLTLNVLPRLDGDRKGTVVRFLAEANLISTPSSGTQKPVVSLAGADLRNISLRGAVLLRRPNFSSADLRQADFRDAFLQRPRFEFANLSGATFDGAEVNEAYFSGCVTGASFRRAELLGAQFVHVSGHDISFAGAFLREVFFTDARLSRVDQTNTTELEVYRPSRWGPSGMDLSSAEVDDHCESLLRRADYPGKGS
jgi:hypothetical protein